MNKRLDALETYLKSRPSAVTEQEDFLAGWDAAIEAAANSVYDFMDVSSYLRAQDVLRKELLKEMT